MKGKFAGSALLIGALALPCAALFSGPEQPALRGGAARAAPLARVAVSVDTPGPLIPPDFDGLSMEYPAVGAYLGATPASPNSVFRRLLANLGQGSLRIGGDSQDTSCWDHLGQAGPPYCIYAIGPTLLRVLFTTAQATGWRLLMGLNLASHDPSMTSAYVKDGILPAAMPGTLLGLEMGNEPDLYAHHGLRPRSFSFTQYVREVKRYVAALDRPPGTAPLPLAGPAFITAGWERQIGSYIAAVGARRLAFATLHYYAADACSSTSGATATAAHLLAEGTMSAMAQQVASYVSAARSQGKAVQMDEVNSIACHGKAGVSNSFAAALWGLDVLFTLARDGLRRVNLHIYDLNRSPGYYNPIVSAVSRSPSGAWTYTTTVRPLYYAMLLFHDAVNRRFLPTALSGIHAHIKAYSVADRATVRVFLLNKDQSAGGPVTLAPSRRLGPGVVTVLQAPSLSATTGTTLGGQAIDPATGLLPRPRTRTIAPDPITGTYTVTLPYASAVMISFPNPSFYLCSVATPPGGVHGICGRHAAGAALRRAGRSRG